MNKQKPDHNRIEADDIKTDIEKKDKRSRSWNPFQKLKDESEALAAAKSGAFVSGYMALSYMIQTAIIYKTGMDTFGDSGSYIIATAIIAVLIAVFLTWKIWVQQPLWSSIVVLLWFATELAFKIDVIATGVQKTNVGWVFMFLVLLSTSILSVRGSWKLRLIRRSKF